MSSGRDTFLDHYTQPYDMSTYGLVLFFALQYFEILNVALIRVYYVSPIRTETMQYSCCCMAQHWKRCEGRRATTLKTACPENVSPIVWRKGIRIEAGGSSHWGAVTVYGTDCCDYGSIVFSERLWIYLSHHNMIRWLKMCHLAERMLELPGLPYGWLEVKLFSIRKPGHFKYKRGF